MTSECKSVTRLHSVLGLSVLVVSLTACTVGAVETTTLSTHVGDVEVVSERLPDGSVRGEIYRASDLAATFALGTDGVGTLEDLSASVSIAIEIDVAEDGDSVRVNEGIYSYWAIATSLLDGETPYSCTSSRRGDCSRLSCCDNEGWCCRSVFCFDDKGITQDVSCGYSYSA